MASPGLDEITTTTLRNRKMEPKKADEKKAIKAAQSGTPVPEKDFSTATKEEGAAAGPAEGSLETAKNLPTPTATSRTVPSTGKQSHGFGHPATAREGHLRHSGHGGAHRVGKKK